jgi:hypothetical protein
MKSKAYLFIRNKVIKFTKENLEKLLTEHSHKDFDEGILKELRRNDEESLEWMLGEILNSYFKQLGYVIEEGWDEIEHAYTRIYKFNNRYIREQFKNGKYLFDHSFEFVKPIKKKIIINTYEPIK